MSIKDRLARKTEGLLPPDGKSERTATAGTPPVRTGPGQMLMVNALTKENRTRIGLLEERLKEFEGAIPTRLLDAIKVVPSKWANRIEESFSTPEFSALKDEIAQAGGNIQPVRVRVLKGESERYEIVFGHRRHRACLELGLPVLAMVEEVNDQELFKAMDRENRERQNLSPWEQGRMYRTALSEGLFGSIGELSREVGVDKGNLSKALALADLPKEIIAAFPSPLDLQFRWAAVLNAAMQKDAAGVMQRARQISAEGISGRTAKEVLEVITDTVVAPSGHSLKANGKTVGKFTDGPKGISIEITKGVLNAAQTRALQEWVEKLIGS